MKKMVKYILYILTTLLFFLSSCHSGKPRYIEELVNVADISSLNISENQLQDGLTFYHLKSSSSELYRGWIIGEIEKINEVTSYKNLLFTIRQQIKESGDLKDIRIEFVAPNENAIDPFFCIRFTTTASSREEYFDHISLFLSFLKKFSEKNSRNYQKRDNQEIFLNPLLVAFITPDNEATVYQEFINSYYFKERQKELSLQKPPENGYKSEPENYLLISFNKNKNNDFPMWSLFFRNLTVELKKMDFTGFEYGLVNRKAQFAIKLDKEMQKNKNLGDFLISHLFRDSGKFTPGPLFNTELKLALFDFFYIFTNEEKLFFHQIFAKISDFDRYFIETLDENFTSVTEVKYKNFIQDKVLKNNPCMNFQYCDKNTKGEIIKLFKLKVCEG